jgi:Dolichyl-phosphate-mannose-protein mannosyltransferase
MERPRFVWLTLAGLLVRVLFLLLEPQAQLIGDEHTWTAWGQELASPGVCFSPALSRIIFYPPVYPYFVALPLALFGSFAAVKACQVLVSALLIPAVGRIAHASFGPGAGRVAAASIAFYPDLVWFSTHFWSETLFLVLLWWAFERLIAADSEADRAAALFAGLLYGVSILTRETALYFAPLAAAWLALGPPRPGRLSRAAAFLGATVLTVAPWTYRNLVVYEAFVPVSTAGGLNLWQGNAGLTREEIYALYAAVPGRIEKYHHAQREGLKAIARRQPLWLVEKLASEMPRFWEADSLALAHLRREAYGPVSSSVYRLSTFVVVAPYVLLLAAFVAGLALVRFERNAVLLLGFLAYYTLLHVATHGFARYRLPALPVLFVFGAAGVAQWYQGSWRTPGAGRRALALVVALILGASVAASLVESEAAEEAAPP